MSEQTTTVTVDVTQEHIYCGVRGKCEDCAVDLAIKDAGVTGMTVLVECVAYETRGGRIETIALPEAASAFIRDFDAFRLVSPLSFPLTVPTRFIRTQSLKGAE